MATMHGYDEIFSFPPLLFVTEELGLTALKTEVLIKFTEVMEQHGYQ